MGQSQYLIDTNSVIDYLGKKISPSGMDFMNGVMDSGPNISVITKIEVLGLFSPKCRLRWAVLSLGTLRQWNLLDQYPVIPDIM